MWKTNEPKWTWHVSTTLEEVHTSWITDWRTLEVGQTSWNTEWKIVEIQTERQLKYRLNDTRSSSHKLKPEWTTVEIQTERQLKYRLNDSLKYRLNNTWSSSHKLKYRLQVLRVYFNHWPVQVFCEITHAMTVTTALCFNQ